MWSDTPPQCVPCSLCECDRQNKYPSFNKLNHFRDKLSLILNKVHIVSEVCKLAANDVQFVSESLKMDLFDDSVEAGFFSRSCQSGSSNQLELLNRSNTRTDKRTKFGLTKFYLL